MNARTVCWSLGEHELSEQLTNFTYLAKKARENFIIEVFFNKNPSPFFKPIPITKQEANAQQNEENMTKAEILLKIKPSLNNSVKILEKNILD